MAQKVILHICVLDKFIPPFLSLINEHFNFEEHIFVLLGDINKFPVDQKNNVFHLKSTKYFTLIKELYSVDKIILHSLFDHRVVKFLFVQPWLLKKCYWVIWGGDLYHYQLRKRNFKANLYEWLRAFVIRRMGHFITYVKGDYELAKKWYGSTGKYHECLIYNSNLYKKLVVPPKVGSDINVLVGNSADPTNNHLEIFEKLKPYKNEDIIIYCPLSYGDAENAERIAKLGKDIFGKKFVPLLDFMTFEKYLELLGQIDVAIFAHKRQQAMGNTISLLGLGKKVYMRNDVTSWQVFKDLNIEVFGFMSFDLLMLKSEIKESNQQKIEQHFSQTELVKQWQYIFGN